MWLLFSLLIGLLLAFLLNHAPRWIQKPKEDAELPDLKGELATLLDAFEARRKRIKMVSDVTNYLLLGGFGVLTGYYFHEVAAQYHNLYTAILLAFGGLFLMVRRMFRLKRFTREYKEEVLRRLMMAIEPSLQFHPRERMPNEELKASHLFGMDEVLTHHKEVGIEGEDYISGTVDDVRLQISDLEMFSGDEKDAKLIFTGSFLVAEFPQRFRGETYITPDFGSSDLLREMFHEISTRKTFEVNTSPVSLDLHAFERVYDAFGTDAEATRALISSEVADRLLQLDGEISDQVMVAVSFLGHKMYLGALFSYLRFEPKLHQPVNRPAEIKKIYDQVTLFISMVRDIRGNARVWATAEPEPTEPQA